MPYLQEFFDFLSPSDTLITTRDVFTEYAAFLATKSTDKQTINAGSSFARFARQFKSLALSRGFVYLQLYGQRGFKAQINGRKTRIHNSNRPIRFCSRPGNDAATSFARNYLQTKEKYFSRLFISKDKGFGAIAVCNMPAQTVVAEYFGH